MFRGLGREVDSAAVDAADAEAYLVGVDPSEREDPVATRELVARRRFVVPTVMTTLEGDEVEIDPADEDQRELLILAEHPQYRLVLDDPFSDELVDGVNPRLHVVMHRIIANQLWDDTHLSCGRPPDGYWPPGMTGTTSCTRWLTSSAVSCTR